LDPIERGKRSTTATGGTPVSELLVDGAADPGGGVQVVDRIAAIFDCFLTNVSEVGIGELSRVTGLSKGTIHRLLAALEQNRFVEQNPATKQYRLGLKLFELGSHAVSQVDLVAVAQPYLQELAEATGETAHLGVIRDQMVLYIAKVEGWHSLRMPSHVGHRMPMYCLGLGKILLAHLNDAELEQYLQTADLKAMTPNTITKLDVLRAELANARRNGFSVDNEELELGLRCIAAPIRDYTGNVVAALSVSGPTTRLTAAKTSELAGNIVRAAAEASERLGGNVP
jgi:DNA-binding IclR family transcriptional regulator